MIPDGYNRCICKENTRLFRKDVTYGFIMAAYDNPGNIKHGMVGWFIVFNPMLSGKSQFKYFTPEDFEKYFERC